MNLIIETVTAFLAAVRNRARLAGGQQAVVVQTAAVIPLMRVEIKLQPSRVLPGQMIIPLAWPVNDLQNHPALEEGEKRPPRE